MLTQQDAPRSLLSNNKSKTSLIC